jgi:hypothetical protein
MRLLTAFLAVLSVAAFAVGAGARENIGSVGPGHGIAVHGSDENPCPGSNFHLNYDGTAENGYCWQYGGLVPPDYGAFAEGYNNNSSSTYICGVALFLSQIGYYSGGNVVDVYVYGSDGNNPTSVLGVTTGLNPGAIAYWPAVSQNDIAINQVAVDGDFFIGYWSNWPGAYCQFYVGADLDGFGGLPRTNIAPGIGYPTGWNDPSMIWGPTMALGIGAYEGVGIPPPDPVPTREATWGSVKHLFH